MRAIRSTLLLAILAASRLPAQLPRSGAVAHDRARESEMLKQVTAPPGFALSLFAGPPVAMYPTCVTATAEGVVFVCVDPNLSLSGDKGRGRVMRLTDDDGDGAADRYSIFAEMDSPRGVAWDGRTLYVMHPPDLTAFRDSDGDGIADRSEVLVRGIGVGLEVRTADHGTNGITLGIDGWLYIAVGDYGFRDAVGRDGTRLQHHGGGVARVRVDGTGLEMYATGTRNIYDVAVSPLLQVFSRDNTNDGDGWDTRLHYLPAGANMGYPVYYRNFASEHMPSLADYGGGAGTAGLWIQDPGFPAGYGNTLFTGDWTVNRILRHPLAPKGASYVAQQETFLGIPHPSDLALDGNSHLYVASLSGGSFNYIGDSVGYVVRVTPTGTVLSRAPALATLTDVALRAVLAGPNDVHRLQAQREILRRGERPGVVAGVTRIAQDRSLSREARVAALFTLRQLIGERAYPALLRAIGDPALRPQAIRALADARDTRERIPTASFVAALTDSSAVVQLEAIAALVRVHAVDLAGSIVPLTASADPAVAHVAVNALAALRASDAALVALDNPSVAIRAGALRALQLMHDPAVVAALVRRQATTSDPGLRGPLTLTLARLHFMEAPWTGDWWGTRPSFIGPYFAPVTWEGTAQITPVLRSSVLAASGTDLSTLLEGLARNRVTPQGAGPLLLALAGGDTLLRKEAVAALVGTSQLGAASLPLLARIDATGRGNHVAVAQLLAGETALPAGSTPLLRAAVLDTLLEPALRAKLLTAVNALPDRAGLEAAAAIYAQLNPPVVAVPAGSAAPAAGPVEAAWRRYVGDRKRTQELDYFIELARTGNTAQRLLGYAVLVQSVRAARPAAAVTAKVLPVLDSAWTTRRAGASLVDAITVMRVEAQYAEKLEAWRNPPPPKPVVPMEWVQLFNGKDLKNWEIKFANHPLGENYNNTFRVEDGLLKVRYDKWTTFNGEFGHLFTREAWSDYLVAVEYRFTGEQVTGAGAGNAWAIRNNGIMVHAQSAASMGLAQDFPISLEVQLLGGLGTGRRPTGNLCTPGTNIVLNGRFTTTHCINSTSETYDGDQWVRVETLVLGDSILKHIVNGDTVLTYTRPTMGGGSANNTNPGVLVEGKPLTSGFIALQAETAPIDFRKAEIVNLKGCMDPAAANYKPWYLRSDPASCRKK